MEHIEYSLHIISRLTPPSGDNVNLKEGLYMEIVVQSATPYVERRRIVQLQQLNQRFHASPPYRDRRPVPSLNFKPRRHIGVRPATRQLRGIK